MHGTIFGTAGSPGDVGVLPDAHVTEHVGRPLGHQHLDLVHGAAELQVAQVQARGEPVGTAPLVPQDVLPGRTAEGRDTRDRSALYSIQLYLHSPKSPIQSQRA